MHNVQVPAESPDRSDTERLVKLKLDSPRMNGNVPIGNATTSLPLWVSVPRRLDRNEWVPEISSLANDESPPMVSTVMVVHAEPLSTVGRFGVAEPDQGGGFATVTEALTM